MSKQDEGFYWFRGARITRGTQRIAVDAPVKVIPIWNRGKLEMGVALLGMQRQYPITAFVGTFYAMLNVESAGND